jgi:hypothetical protein
MSLPSLLPTTATNRSKRPVGVSPAVLIEVPAVRSRRMRRVTPVLSARLTRRNHQARRRRRLRREVRLMGCALLALAPLVSAGTMAWSGKTSRVVACSISDPASDGDPSGSHDGRASTSGRPRAAVGSPGVVLLSIEPAVVSPGSDADVPVVFPGYVLPDDSHEDKTHEGS